MTQNPTNTTPPQGGQTPPQGDPTGQTPANPQGQTPQGQQNQQQQQKTPLTDLPPDVQDYIKLLRNEAKQTREQLEAEARAKQEAEERRKQEQGQFKELAEQRQTRISQLEPYESRYNALAELLKGQLEGQIKDWPAEVKAFDPGAEAPIEQRIAWVEKSRPLVSKLIQQQQGQAPGNSPNPQPANQGVTQQQGVAELRQRYQNQRGNPI